MMEQKNYKKVEQSYELRTTSYKLIKNVTMKKIIILLGFILLVPFTAKSQVSVMDEPDLPNRFIGLTGGVGLVSYTGSFLLLGNEVDCEPYNFKTNTEFQTNLLFGLRAEWKISKHFDFYTSLLYEDRFAKFDPLDYQQPEYISDERPFELVNFKQELNVKINVLSITPMIKYRPFKFDFAILVGPSVAFIFLDELDGNESILAPADIVYATTSERERIIYSGKIEPKNSFLLDLKFGLSCGFMLTKHIKFSPEVFYVYPLTQVSSEGDWKISSIQFLGSLSFRF
jgi:hypothetical protein